MLFEDAKENASVIEENERLKRLRLDRRREKLQRKDSSKVISVEQSPYSKYTVVQDSGEGSLSIVSDSSNRSLFSQGCEQ